MSELEKALHRDMLDIYRRADKELGYKATRFLQMLSECGGLATATALVTKPGGTDGFTVLWEYDRLDLSVEALVLQDRYTDLFTDEVRTICRNRLKEYGYTR